MISRRKLLIEGGKAFLALSACNLPFARGTGPLEVHRRIAEYAKEKYGKKGKNLTLLYPKGSFSNVKAAAVLFTKATGIPVRLKEGSLDDIGSEVLLEKRLNGRQEIVDVALPATFSVPDLAHSGALCELTEFASKHENLGSSVSALYPHGDRYQEELYGYQTDGDAYMMFYNKPWLEDKRNQDRFFKLRGKALGIPKTWEELDGQMRFFHRPEEGRYGGALFRNFNYAVWEFWLRLHGKGLFPLTDSFEPQFQKERGVLALQELIEATKSLEPGAGKNNLFENWESFSKGDKFCNIGSYIQTYLES